LNKYSQANGIIDITNYVINMKDKIKRVLDKNKIRGGLSNFEKEFRRQLATFITGAFAFVAALLWKDAIRSYLDRYQSVIESMMPIKESWFVQLATALLVTVVAVIVIIVVSNFLNPKK